MIEARRQRDAALFQSKRAEFQSRFAYQIMSELGSDGRPITIKQLMQTGIEVLEKNYGDDPRFVISVLTNISGRYMDLGDTDGEYAALVKAERLARKLGDPAQIASVQCDTVETELAAGRPEKAAARMHDGFANLARIANPTLDLRIQCDYAFAKLKWDQGDRDGGIAVARRVAALMEKNRMETDIKYDSVVSLLEIMLADAGNTREAMSWNHRAAAALERAGRGKTMSMNGLRHNEALYYYDAGDIRASYEREKAVAQEIIAQQGMDSVPPAVSQRVGIMQTRIEETDAGLEWLDRALAAAKAQNNLPVQVAALMNRARAQMLLGRPDQAMADIKEALSHADDVGALKVKVLQAAQQIRAQVSLEEGDATGALRTLGGLLTELGYPQNRTSLRLVSTLNLRARTESSLGRHAEALATAKQALAVAEEHALTADHSADVGAALMEMAQAQRALGDAAGAQASAKRAATALANGLGPNHSETRAAAAF